MTTELETNDLIVRHNNLINARIRLNAQEYDVIRTFMKLIQREDSDFWSFSIPARDVGVDYKRGRNLVRSIGRKPLEIDLGEQNFTSIPFFSILKYKNGYFEGKFNKDLKEVLLEISGNFTKTYERYILPMSSIYAKRIYEMLVENKKLGYRRFNLEKLYDILQVPKSMKSYSRFKEKVLLTAIKEINKHTDIYIPVDTENLKDESWVKLQCGKTRKITHLNFEFRLKSDKGLFAKSSAKEQQKLTIDTLDLTQNIVDDLLVDCGIAQTGDNTLIQEFELKLHDILEAFKKWVKENNKQFFDLEYSFKKYVKDGFENGYWVV